MELYRRSDPAFEGRATVPFLWDTRTERIVSNDYPQLTLDLSTEWSALHGPDAPDLYPSTPGRPSTTWPSRTSTASTTASTSRLRHHAAGVRAGVRRAVRAAAQLDQHLQTERYLVGRQLSEADVRLFTTLVRFDAAYHGHFKCNERKLTEFANLWPYARDLFQTPGFGDTTDFDHIKRHYYGTHDKINPTLVVPKGPDLSGWTQPHGRDHLGDSTG
jgi:putative glutathione S-transferase